MALFIVLLVVPMAIQHIAVRGHYIDYRKRNKFALAFFFFLLTVLIMLRHETVGRDTQNYIYYFRRFTRADWSTLADENLEFGYVVFNKLVSVLSDHPQFFLAAAAMVISAMIYPTYGRLCTDASLTIVLFCTMSTFMMMFSGIRQMMAVAIGFVAYGYVRRKKRIHFLLAVLAGCMFHTSAFMLLFMYPLYHAKITKKWLIAVVPALVLVFLLNRQIFSVLSLFLERYTKYDASISSTGAYTMLILFAAFAVFSFLIPEEAQLDGETIGLRNFLLFALVLQMFAPLHMLAMRMNYYYIIFIPLLIPKIIACKSKLWTRVAILGRHIMVAFFFVYDLITVSRSGGLNVFPYHFFWEMIR